MSCGWWGWGCNDGGGGVIIGGGGAGQRWREGMKERRG